jgi:hypothetical protein
MVYDVVHAHVHLVQEPGVEEIAPFNLGMIQPSLSQE